MNSFSHSRRLSVLLAFTLVGGLPASAEARTFTDNQGREIEAEVTKVSGSKVTLRLTNGKSYTLPIEKLSTADQLFVEVWKDEAKNPPTAKKDDGKDDSPPKIPANVKYDFEFEADKERVQKGDKSKVAAGTVRQDDWIYQVELENRSRVKLEGLEMSYRIYVDTAATAKLSSALLGPPKFYGGRAKVDPVDDGASVIVKTKKMKLADLELNAGYVFNDGSRSDLNDKIEGIWIKLWHGEKKVAEYKSTHSTVKKAKWLDDDPADPEAKKEE